MVTITDLLSTADKADLNEDDDLDVTESLYPSSPELLEATEVVSRYTSDVQYALTINSSFSSGLLDLQTPSRCQPG